MRFRGEWAMQRNNIRLRIEVIEGGKLNANAFGWFCYIVTQNPAAKAP